MRFTIIAFITFLLNSTVFGCSCGGPDTFCETLGFGNFIEEYSAVKAVMLGAVNHGMDVKVINSYNGEISNDTIRVWGDNGILCRVYTDRFVIGDTIIMKLYTIYKISEGFNGIGEKVGDYELSICGLHYLRVKNNKVVGNITAQTQEMEIAEFEEIVRDEKLFEVCIETNVEEEEEETETDVEETDLYQDLLLYPNPVGEELRIVSNQSISGIKIYNNLGQNIYNRMDFYNNEFDLNFSEFKPGLYFVEIVNSRMKSITKKIYKK